MARAPDAEDLTCSVCLSIFTEPVTLGCGHSFCRGCVKALPEAQCPQCRATFPSVSDLQLLQTNHILKSLSERAKERPQREHRPGTQEPGLCPEHEERMKLFCVTDQLLACIICRDGEAHDGHKFKPIREAAAALRRDIEPGLVNVESQVNTIQNMMQTQSSEMEKAKELSSELKKQVQGQFEAMQQFLKKREQEILGELRLKEEDAVGNMSENLNDMKKALSECEELKESWTQIMEVTDPEMFLRRWSEEHSAAAVDLFTERTKFLEVVPSPLFEDPQLSYLQFFMWKEMLQVVEPKPDLITLIDENLSLTVSEDQRSFHCAPQSRQPLQKCSLPPRGSTSTHGSSGGTPSYESASTYGSYGDTPIYGSASTYGSYGDTPIYGSASTYGSSVGTLNRGGGLFDSSVGSSGCSGFVNKPPVTTAVTVSRAIVPRSFRVSSTNKFSSGQHYWEVELRLRDFWCVGVTDFFLKYKNKKYHACKKNKSTEVSVSDRLLKLGVHLNCSSKTLTFYDADSMKRLHEVHCDGLTLPVSAYFCIRQKEPDTNPLTVCRY